MHFRNCKLSLKQFSIIFTIIVLYWLGSTGLTLIPNGVYVTLNDLVNLNLMEVIALYNVKLYFLEQIFPKIKNLLKFLCNNSIFLACIISIYEL